MKAKNLFASALLATALLFSVNNTASAQRPNREDMQARRAEMVAQQAERLAKDLDLKGDQKTSFVATYKQYREELQSVQQGQQGQRPQQGQQERKKLTDEEAQKQLDEYFARQEQQIAQQQKRLEVERKYFDEFKKTLTPQQLVKVFRQRQMQRQGGQRQGFGGPQGGFGGNGGGMRQGGFGGNGGGMGGDF